MAFVDMTSWIPVDEAKAKIAELIENGTFEKTQIKKSSNLFANRKDKSDGYVCRVLIEEGIHPELEMPKKEKKTKAKSKKAKKAEAAESQVVVSDNRRYVVEAQLVDKEDDKDVGLYLIDQGGKFWVERQVIGGEKEIVSKVVDTEADARLLMSNCLLKFKK